MSELTPLNGYVVLIPKEEGEVLSGNIIIPDLGKEKPAIGEVVAFSPWYNVYFDKVIPPDFKVGDTVLIPKMGSTKISIDGVDYYLCKTVEVIGIIQK